MRALVFRGPWDLAVETRPDPVPGPGEVLVKVLATGICGSDLHGFTGENGRRFPGQVMGHETVGTVVEHGPGVDDAPAPSANITIQPVIGCGACRACLSGNSQRCPSKQVIGVTPALSSAFAEYLVAPAANVVALPEGLQPELGALVEPLAVGYHAAVRGRCDKDDMVLVIGGGPIGQASALAAGRLGATRIVVSEPHPGRRKLLESIGLTAVDPTAGPLSETLDEPATLVLDAVGSSRSLADALSASEPGGSVVLVGMQEPSVSLQAYEVSTQERTIIGSFCYSPREFADTARWAGESDQLAELVDGRVSLDEGPEAFRSLAKGENPASKVLVLP